MAQHTASKMIKNDKSLADIPIIMMTAFGKKDEMELAKKIGIDAFLSKPFTKDHLLGVVMNIFGAFNDDKKSDSDETHMITKGSLDMGKLSGAQVLLVEDYELNRQVVLEILEHYNVKADIAENGKIGVEKAALKKYDAILMDVQMPEMDGIEASKRIRAMEGLEDVPIIAMTAHAMKGDKERFLESGMTDYISKPINIEKIVAVLTTRIKRIAPAKSDLEIDPKNKKDKSLAAAPIGDIPGINVEDALKRINNNRDLFVDLLRGFVEAGTGLCDDVKTSIEKDNTDEAARAIHNLKGISGAISADDVHEIVKKLEESVRGNGENMADLINKTSTSLEIVLQSIDIFLKNETERLDADESESLDESLENPNFDIIKQTVSKLFDFLGRHDLDAEDELIKLKSHMKPLGDDFSDNLKELAGSIEKFNYIDAIKTLEIISKAIKGLG